MTYINNQYIRLDKPIEEIAKIKIKTDKKNKLIEDIEIGDYVNVVIAYGDKMEYDNIYGGVKILITDEKALKKNEYKIPEYIEKIIVYGYIYDNNEREIERIKEELKNGLELINCLKLINSYNKEKIALDILEKQNININQVDKEGDTALIYACIKKMESVALKLLEREDINVNQVNKNGFTALIIACAKELEIVALKLLKREDLNVNQVNKQGGTALGYAIKNNMASVINKIDELIKK